MARLKAGGPVLESGIEVSERTRKKFLPQDGILCLFCHLECRYPSADKRLDVPGMQVENKLELIAGRVKT